MNRSEEEKPQHPIGTLAILLVYGLLFGAGWLVFYFFIFLPRGPILP